MTVIGSSLYVYGGEHVARTPVDSSIHVMNHDSGKWSLMSVADDAASVPVPRVASAQTRVDGAIYVFGGRQGITMEEKPLGDMCRDASYKLALLKGWGLP